jgi:hypothetical protein
MMNLRVVASAGLLLLAMAAPALAQRIDTPYRFFDHTQAAGLTAAYISTDKGSVGLGPESGMAFGGRYHIRLSGPFYIEGEALYFPTTRAVLDTAVVDSAFEKVGEADLAIASVTASLRFNLTGQRTWNRLLPFIVAGVGIAIEAGDDEEADVAVPGEARFDFGTTFAGQVGAGFELFPVERLAIRVDGRALFWQLDTPQGLLTADLGRTLPVDEWTNNLTASIGLSLHF